MIESFLILKNAFIAAIFASILCGIIGTYIVSRKLVFMSGGVSHSAFGGVGMSYFFGINPLIGAAIFSILTALGIQSLKDNMKIREDSSIGMFWVLGMAIGVIFTYITPGYPPNLTSYLFGNILLVSTNDLYLIISLTVISIIIFSVFYKKILFVAFDQTFAKTKNIRVNLINYLMLILIALTIVFSIKITGIIMVISLLTIPQVTANIMVKDFKKIIYLSIIFGLVASLLGLALSIIFNIPSGATIVMVLFVQFMVVYLVNRLIVDLKSRGV